MIQTFQSVDAARLHFRDGSRIHGIITNGGQAVNIIPEKTECEFLCRAHTTSYTHEIADRVPRCADYLVTLLQEGFRDERSQAAICAGDKNDSLAHVLCSRKSLLI